MSIEHYENFPVASWLCPPALRPTVAALYAYARTADDLADEGDVPPAERLRALRAYREALDLALADTPDAEARWPQVFTPLRAAIRRHALPAAPLHDLLSAFEQDVHNPTYPDRDTLLAYCRRSANPVGRLLLHLYGIGDAAALTQSDAICSALQLINFWQDLGVDRARGRCYVPASDLQRHGLDASALQPGHDSAASRALLRELCDWTEALMRGGAPLAHRVPGRAGWELRLVVQGGLRILEKIRAMDHACLTHRPTLGRRDALPLLLRAITMRAPEPRA
jgi:squalene synthase HpnC